MPNGTVKFFRYMYVFLWNYGMLDSEQYNAIEDRHFEYCEEVLGYSYTVDEPLPPDDIRAGIEAELSRIPNKNTNNWGLTGDILYFGEYNDYHVFFAKGFSEMWLDKLYVGPYATGYEFPMSGEYSTFGYKDGVLYQLDDLYESGEVTGDDIEKMVELSYVYNLHVYRNSLKTK